MSSRKRSIRPRHVQSSRSKSTEELSSPSSEFCWNGAELYRGLSFYLASVASSTSSPIRSSRSRSQSSQSYLSIHHHSSVRMPLILMIIMSSRPDVMSLCNVLHVPVAFSFYIKTACGLYRPTRGPPGPLRPPRGSPGPPGPGSELWPPRVLMAYSLKPRVYM